MFIDNVISPSSDYWWELSSLPLYSRCPSLLKVFPPRSFHKYLFPLSLSSFFPLKIAMLSYHTINLRSVWSSGCLQKIWQGRTYWSSGLLILPELGYRVQPKVMGRFWLNSRHVVCLQYCRVSKWCQSNEWKGCGYSPTQVQMFHVPEEKQRSGSSLELIQSSLTSTESWSHPRQVECCHVLFCWKCRRAAGRKHAFSAPQRGWAGGQVF